MTSSEIDPTAAELQADESVKKTGRIRRQLGIAILCIFAPLAIFFWSKAENWEKLCSPILDGNPGEFDLSQLSVPSDQILGGGPGKDGIPALTEPVLITAEEARYLQPDDRVIGVVIDHEPRAYPLKVLNSHEIINDRVGDVPFAVTYCPLCDSAAVFDRRLNDEILEFGVSGLLYNSNVLMFDRRGNSAKESLWSQVQGSAIAGTLLDQELRTLPLTLTTWEYWSGQYPNSKVVSDQTGHGNDYSSNPYGGYFQNDNLMFPVDKSSQEYDYPNKSPVLGVWHGDNARAYPLVEFKHLDEELGLPQKLGEIEFTLNYQPDAKSLSIETTDERIEQMYAFWFAWYAFRPKTDVFSFSGDRSSSKTDSREALTD